MLSPLDVFYEKQTEPIKSCLLYIRQYLLSSDENISEALKYGLPMFLYKGKMLCYFWFDKKTKIPYIGFMKGKFLEHPKLEQGNRKLVKVYEINPEQDILIEEIESIVNDSKPFFKA